MRATWKAGTLGLIISAFVLAGASVASADSLTEGWSGDVFAGYNKTSGNTKKGSANLAASALKKFERSELLLRGSMFYSESNKSMDAQKWEALTKYSYDIGKEKKWFSFYQFLVDHDYFADIDYRMTPSAGLGYHIFRTEEWTWDVDAGLGYRITRHRVDTRADDEVPTAIFHTFMKRKVFENAFLSHDLTVYPGLKSNSGVLLRAETAFTNSLTKSLDLELKHILDYNSEPSLGKKKSDSQMIAGLKYKY